jgi:ectoine hydroxylase-related dioxygenase (phytanoyl-CoA dioxygenase family)
MVAELEHKGFAIVRNVYSKTETNQMKNLIHLYFKEFPEKELHAIRALLKEIPALRELIFNENLIRLLKRIDPELFLTKAIFFDKTPESNWYVTWHQDTTINVRAKIELPGYAGWTKKEGFFGVNPPDEILKNTLAFRIHLDDAEESNGALKVILGSQNKKLSESEIQLIVQNSIPFACEVEAGGIHVMRPLLLHASSKSTNQKHRRVLHLEFSLSRLDNGLKWAEQVI